MAETQARSLEDMATLSHEARDSYRMQRYEKFGKFSYRPAVPGEIIETVIDGVTKTKNVAKSGDVVITGAVGEQYIIGSGKFGERYQVDVSEGLPVCIPAPGSAEIEAFIYNGEPFSFMAPWGESMIVEDGDTIATTGGSDIYRIHRSLFEKTYRLRPTLHTAWEDGGMWGVWMVGHVPVPAFVDAVQRMTGESGYSEGIFAPAHAEQAHITKPRGIGVENGIVPILWSWCAADAPGATPVTAYRWEKQA